MYKGIKRLLDVVLSLSLIVVLSPLYIVLYVLVVCKLGKPAIFKQERPGYKGKIFTMYKFRSMTDEKDANGNVLSDEERLTPFGKRLRSTSLDELPELFNILKGDMSFVGPRPLLVSYLELYNEEQMRRHDVRPGLTGLAQANGRNAISWQEKFAYDVYYVDHISFIMDVKVCLKTIKVVFQKDGISASEHVTMEPFRGNE